MLHAAQELAEAKKNADLKSEVVRSIQRHSGESMLDWNCRRDNAWAEEERARNAFKALAVESAEKIAADFNYLLFVTRAAKKWSDFPDVTQYEDGLVSALDAIPPELKELIRK